MPDTHKSHKKHKSRSKSPEKSSRKRSRRSERSERHERKRKKNSAGDDTFRRSASPPKDEDRGPIGVENGSDLPGVDSGGGEISLSVEETNKLRAKLGLAPLDTDESTVRDAKSGDPNEKIVVEDGFEFRHKPASNWADKKQAEKLREKLEATKGKRKYMEKLEKVRGLGDEDEEDSAAAWVERSRKLEEERRQAEQRAKALAEMDEEFGVSEILEKEASKKKRRDPTKYSARDLAGLTVEHSKEAFLEGKETILVLKDKGVLEEDDGEALINPSLVESEMWKNNAEIRKTKKGYNPYDIDDFDSEGNLREKTLLGKYDEKLDGKKTETFKLDGSGTINANAQKEKLLADIRAKMRTANQISLSQQGPLKLANEYFTRDEMLAKFKKPKKKVKKLRRREMLKADDLMPIADDGDFGSRKRGKGRKRAEYEDETEAKMSDEDTKTGAAKFKSEQLDDIDDDLVGPDEDLSQIEVDDDAEDELHSVLEKARRLKQMEVKTEEESTSVGKVSQLLKHLQPDPSAVKEEPMDEDEPTTSGQSASANPDEDEGPITLDATSEYCRGLGDIPTYGLAGNRMDAVDPEEFVDKEMEKKQRKEARELRKQEKLERKERKKKDRNRPNDIPDDEFELRIREHRESRGQWVETDFHQEQKEKEQRRQRDQNKEHADSSDSDSSDSDADPVLGKEMDVGVGVGNALKLAMQKGYLEKIGDGKPNGPSLKHLESQRYTIMDKQFHDIDDKYAKKLERMGTGGGPMRTFEDKQGYDPSVNITYTDELGRHMDMKDAFRYQSWKFHGKMPGKKKVEKRAKKVMEKELMTQMNSSDTPLGTLGKQLDKQKSLQVPYIVLSGSSREMGASIKKER